VKVDVWKRMPFQTEIAFLKHGSLLEKMKFCPSYELDVTVFLSQSENSPVIQTGCDGLFETI